MFVAELTGRTLMQPAIWLVAEEHRQQTLLMRLDPANRAKVIMALLGLVLVGAALVALVWLGGRRLRRIARERSGPTPPHQDDWYRKPLAPPNAEPNEGRDSE